jgi:hypothetical protein
MNELDLEPSFGDGIMNADADATNSSKTDEGTLSQELDEEADNPDMELNSAKAIDSISDVSDLLSGGDLTSFMFELLSEELMHSSIEGNESWGDRPQTPLERLGDTGEQNQVECCNPTDSQDDVSDDYDRPWQKKINPYGI